MKKNSTWLLILCTLCAGEVSAQKDTLQLDLSGAEELFLKNNLELINSKYQIQQSEADIITAKLFDNPELSYENLFYNHDTKKFLETSYKTGQYSAQISQLFKLAGKRNKNVILAESSVKLLEQNYFDIIRTLRFQLQTSFYKYYFNSESIKVYELQITSTKQLLSAYQQQFKLGNVAQKDVLRIKSLLINLQSELNSILNELDDNATDLKILCGLSAEKKIKLRLSISNKNPLEIITYNSLIDSARMNRADLKLAKVNLLYNEANLKMQKAIAVPDIALSLNYDLKGNYPEKYTGLGISIPLPLFNRNQGEIKKAKIGIDIANSAINKQESILEIEVANSYKTALRNENIIQEIDPLFNTDFNQMIKGLIKNFTSRNISLMEFLDLYDAYKENTLKLNNLQLERMNSRAELNYVTGTNIFK